MSHSSDPASHTKPATPGTGHATRPARCQARPPAQHPIPPRQPRSSSHGHHCVAPRQGCELTDEDREWVRRTVACLPPLTSRQRDILRQLLHTPH